MMGSEDLMTDEEFERLRAEMRQLDAVIEWVCWIGMGAIALSVLLWGLLA